MLCPWQRLNVHYILQTYRKSHKLSKKIYALVWQWKKSCYSGMVLLCYQFTSFYLVILSYNIQGSLWSWWWMAHVVGSERHRGKKWEQNIFFINQSTQQISLEPKPNYNGEKQRKQSNFFLHFLKSSFEGIQSQILLGKQGYVKKEQQMEKAAKCFWKNRTKNCFIHKHTW